MSLDDCAEMLSNFGLTHNQARIYIATVQLGIATISQVSNVSKVRREEVYRTLPKLEKLGLIEKTLGKPAKVRATPVEEALSILIQHEQDIANKKICVLMTERDAFLKSFQLMHAYSQKPKLDEAHFTLIQQREAIIHKRLAIIKDAKKAIDIITSRDEFSHFFTNHIEQIKKAIERGVKLRIVLDIGEHGDSILRIREKYKSSRTPLFVKYTDQPLFHYTIVDYKEALVATSIESISLGRNPYLWTSDSNLVTLLQKNFESIWHTSVNIEIIETQAVTNKLIHFLRELRPTNHAIFLYGSHDAKYNVLFNYLKVGLQNGEAVVYVATEEDPSRIRETIKKFGVNVKKSEKAGALRILGYDEFYIVKGKFDIPTTLGLIGKMYNEALKKGFKGCRIFGDMACFFEHNLVEELLEYERELHRVLDIPIIGMCAYNTNMLTKADDPLDLYNELLKAHSTVLFTGLDKKLGKIEIRQA